MNQLVMIRHSLARLPSPDLPNGYQIRTFEPGDEQHWETIIGASFETPRSFQTVMAEDPGFAAGRLIFALRDNVPVATAAAWHHPLWGGEYGYLFFVAVLPSDRGRGLGYFVSLAALHRFVAERRQSAVLETDDHRVSAIKTYLKLGFSPHVTEETRERWRTIDQSHHLGLGVPTEEQWFRENSL